MEALHLNERERTVVYEGGYILGKEDGLAEGLEKGLQQGREEGLEEGLAQGREAVALAMLRDGGMSVSEIARYTGLSEEVLSALKP